jgi:hypothetical protein
MSIAAAAILFVCVVAGGAREFRDTPCDSARPAVIDDAWTRAELPEEPRVRDERDPFLPGRLAGDGSSWQHLGWDARGRPVGLWVPAGSARVLVLDAPPRRRSHRR